LLCLLNSGVQVPEVETYLVRKPYGGQSAVRDEAIDSEAAGEPEVGSGLGGREEPACDETRLDRLRAVRRLVVNDFAL